MDLCAGRQGHTVEECREAIRALDPWRGRYGLLRMRLDAALPLFRHGRFAFVHVDGFAHTAEEESRTTRDGVPKLADGGVFAGHDDDPAWPRVVQQVDALIAADPGRELSAAGGAMPDPEDRTNRVRSWFTIRPL